jgi:hypothetical protein
MAIDAKIKKKWVAALRSGKYPQGIGRLCSSDGSYCCLGVLADIVDPDENSWYGYNGIFGTKDSDAQQILLGGYISFRKAAKLIEMNDGRKRLSFKEIAKFIAADRFI